MSKRSLSPELIASLKRLRLGGLIPTLAERFDLADKQSLPYEDLVLMLLTDEIGRRDSTAAARRADEAGLDTDAVNAKLDEAWQFFSANESTVMPLLRLELESELALEQPNQMLILDIGRYVRLQPDAGDKELGLRAFFAIDPDAEVVRWNDQNLFMYAYDVARDRDPRSVAGGRARRPAPRVSRGRSGGVSRRPQPEPSA